MKKMLFLFVTTVLVVCFTSLTGADAQNTLYVDDDGLCGGNNPCYTHPQDAVNAANPRDTILVYPGTYGTRISNCEWCNCFDTPPSNCGCDDTSAPALIVYKNGLTIQAIGTAAETIIESIHQCWSNPMPLKKSTNNAVGSIAAPNGVSIIADGVTIEGFTPLSEYIGDPNVVGDWPNTAGIMIGGLYAGDQTHLGVVGTTVENCIIFGHSGIYNWKASNTTMEGNSVTIIPAAPAATEHNGNGIVVWDGWFEGAYPPTSTGVKILNNTVDTCDVDLSLGGEGKGIMFGGTDSTQNTNGEWCPAPSPPCYPPANPSYAQKADQSGMLIDGNTICAASSGIKFWNSTGTDKLITCDNTITFGTYRIHDYGVDEGYPPSTWTDLFGYCQNGTGTPGYWMNHPEAWPFDSIVIGGVMTYTKEEAIAQMFANTKNDVTYIMFQSLVAAKLNVLVVGYDSSCITDTITDADEWMADYGPVGSGVKAGGKGSPWRTGELLYLELDAYNNGYRCVPHRY